MLKEREAKIDPNQAALIVTYGNTTRKHRPLDRDLVVLGRSSCCDVGLVSPEVAPIHCVILRCQTGWRVRDCTGRSGTRVNGKAIHDEPLNDGDTLQIGTFSFQLNLPRILPVVEAPTAEAPVSPSKRGAHSPDEARIKRLKKSRERLARQAMSLRRRLQEQQGMTPPPGPQPPPADPDYDAKQAELDKVEKRLQTWEKELAEQDRGLREEYAELEHRRKELEGFTREVLTKKQAELEQLAKTQLAARREELEAESARILAERQAGLDQFADSLQTREHDLELERRRLEENVLKQLADEKAALAAAQEQVRKQQRDFEAQLLQQFEDQKETLAATEENLVAQQRELQEKWQQVEQARAEAAEAREALRLEFEDADRIREEGQEDVAARVRDAEAYLDALWQQCEAHRRRVEEQHGPINVPDVAALTRDLDIRARELAALTQHLQRKSEALTQYEQELAEAYQQFQVEYEQAMQQTPVVRGAPQAESTVPSESLSIAEEIIADLRQEAEKLRAEFSAQLAAENQRATKAEDELKFVKIDLVEARKERRQFEKIVDELREELKQLAEKRRPASLNGETALAQPERLMALIEKLQQDVAERDNRLNDLHRELDELRMLADPAEKKAYEESLNNYRLELEQDRERLTAELAQMQESLAEVDEARQEAELQFAQERAQIAREWVEINRVRESLRREVARLQQADLVLRDRAAKPKTITPETRDTPSSATPTPAPQPDLIARLSRNSKHT